MFKLAPCPEFTADVPTTRPGEDKPGTLRLRFRHKSRQEYRDWLAKHSDSDVVDGLLEAVCGWDGVEDDEGNQVPFSREAFARLLDLFPASAIDILKAYGRALHESRTGN
jgi:hypothetical protein